MIGMGERVFMMKLVGGRFSWKVRTDALCAPWLDQIAGRGVASTRDTSLTRVAVHPRLLKTHWVKSQRVDGAVSEGGFLPLLALFVAPIVTYRLVLTCRLVQVMIQVLVMRSVPVGCLVPCFGLSASTNEALAVTITGVGRCIWFQDRN